MYRDRRQRSSKEMLNVFRPDISYDVKSFFKNGNVYSARILEFRTNSRKRRNKKQSSLRFRW